MVACTIFAVLIAINASRLQLEVQRFIQENVIKAKAAISFPTLPLVVPIRVDALAGMLCAEHVHRGANAGTYLILT
jgi:hypothetical protein